MYGILRSADQLVGRALNAIATACFVALFLTVAFVVASRLGGLPSTGWTDELIELLFAWLIFTGTAALWRVRGHFAVDLLFHVLRPGATRRRIEAFGEALCLVFLVVFVWQATVFIAYATDESPVFAISKVYWYGVMPLAGVIMIAHSAARLVELLRGNEDSHDFRTSS